MTKLEAIVLDINYAVADVKNEKNPQEKSRRALKVKYEAEKLLAQAKKLIANPDEE